MVMEIIREGLIITPTGSLEPSQGSYDVPVKLINDETYPYYTINMYVGYYVNGVIKKRKCETDSEGHYLIPGIAFLRSGIISISFLLETADKSQGLMTNALSYEIKHAPNVVVEVPADPTWQELVKEWIQELAGAVNVDNTLTKSGMAADAKATGDAISKLSDSIANLNSGTPTTVSIVSEMTDISLIYLYTGTEDGYISGNWYYYDGSAWVSGGKYGSASGVGWTSTQIALLETLFGYLTYDDSVTGQAIADNLIASLKSGSSSGSNDNTEEDSGGDSSGDSGEETPTSYTITYSLLNVTTDNESTSIEANGSYTANLTPDSNYYIGSITITMGGVNVTDIVYADGVITIAEVTGNVVIVASGTESDNLITAEVLEQCGTGDYPDGTEVKDDSNMLMTPFIAVQPNTKYYHNLIDSNNIPDGWYYYNLKWAFYDKSQTYIKVLQMINKNYVETPEGAYYLRVTFYKINTNPYVGLSGVIV